jgi:hypothetical protein
VPPALLESIAYFSSGCDDPSSSVRAFSLAVLSKILMQVSD